MTQMRRALRRWYAASSDIGRSRTRFASLSFSVLSFDFLFGREQHLVTGDRSMAKLSIRLPDKMKQFVDDQTQEGQFADEAAYIQDLINQDQVRQKEVARIQAIVDAGIASGESDESMLDILHSLKDHGSKSA